MSTLTSGLSRRHALGSIFGAGLGLALAQSAQAGEAKPIQYKDKVKITKLETFLVKPRWIFLKIHTDAGIECVF